MKAADRARRNARASTLLVAEGDSWFDFPPFFDVLKHLRCLGYAVKSVADYSHTLRHMATCTHQIGECRALLRELKMRGTAPKAILLSGGGNDLIGVLEELLNDFGPNVPALNGEAVSDFIDHGLRDDYLTWLREMTAMYLDVFGTEAPAPILIHGYAHAVPDGREGALGQGPWLQPEFHAKGHQDLARNTQTMELLIDQINCMLSDLPGEADLGHVRYVDVRGVLSNDLSAVGNQQTGQPPPRDRASRRRADQGLQKYRRDWGDELHPTYRGFCRVAKRIAKEIDALP